MRPLTEQEQHIVDMKQLALDDKSVAPLISASCPECEIPIDFVVAGKYTHPNGRVTINACRLRDGVWWYHGIHMNGSGTEKGYSDGTGAGGDTLCPIDPLIAIPLTDNGSHPGEAEEVLNILERGDQIEIRDTLNIRLKNKTSNP